LQCPRATHASLLEVARYTKAADQKRLAVAAMEKAKARTEIGQSNKLLAKKEKEA
jgi:hypothetical protein